MVKTILRVDIDRGKGIDGQGPARRILRRKTLPTVFDTPPSGPEMVDRVRGITRKGSGIKIPDMEQVSSQIVIDPGWSGPAWLEGADRGQ